MKAHIINKTWVLLAPIWALLPLQAHSQSEPTECSRSLQHKTTIATPSDILIESIIQELTQLRLSSIPLSNTGLTSDGKKPSSNLIVDSLIQERISDLKRQYSEQLVNQIVKSMRERVTKSVENGNALTLEPHPRKAPEPATTSVAQIRVVMPRKKPFSLDSSKDMVSVALSPDGKTLATVNSNVGKVQKGSTSLWDPTNGSFLRELVAKKTLNFFDWNNHKHNSARTVSFSPNGELLATTGYYDNLVKLWSAKDGSFVRTLSGHKDRVRSADFSPDNQYLLTTSDDLTARIWKVSDGSFVSEFTDHWLWVLGGGFSPDGRLVATASADSTAKIWKVEDGSLVANLQGHKQAVFKAKFSPDGKYVVTASSDASAKVWLAEDGSLLFDLLGHGNNVMDAVFFPDGRTLVTISSDGTAKFWRMHDGSLITTLEAADSGLTSVAISPDSQLMILSSVAAPTTFWDLNYQAVDLEKDVK